MNKYFAIAFLVFALPGVSNAAQPNKFNLKCQASKVELTGTNTWKEDLFSPERRDAWLAEHIEIAIDLETKTYCNANYCAPESYGAPEKINSIKGDIYTLDIRPIKEYESNDYNMIASDYIWDAKKQTLVDHYKYYDEAGEKILGNQIITYSCQKSEYRLLPPQ